MNTHKQLVTMWMTRIVCYSHKSFSTITESRVYNKYKQQHFLTCTKVDLAIGHWPTL